MQLWYVRVHLLFAQSRVVLKVGLDRRLHSCRTYSMPYVFPQEYSSSAFISAECYLLQPIVMFYKIKCFHVYVKLNLKLSRKKKGSMTSQA